MMRATLNLASFCLLGLILCSAVLTLGFFASPEAVRSSPPVLYNSLLLEAMADH